MQAQGGRGVNYRIEPITAESTEGWDRSILVEADAVPREGDYMTVEVNGRQYDGLYVRKVLWRVTDDVSGEVGVIVRVR